MTLSPETLSWMVKEYKMREKEQWIDIHDIETHPEQFNHEEQFTLWYWEHDWLWIDKVYRTSKDTIRRLSENDIDLGVYQLIW